MTLTTPHPDHAHTAYTPAATKQRFVGSQPAPTRRLRTGSNSPKRPIHTSLLGTFGLWTYIIVSTFLVLSLLARTPRQPTTTTLLLLDLLVTLTTVIGNFAYMYWNAGTAHNFTQPLT